MDHFHELAGPLLALLHQHPQGLSEYQLIERLRQQGQPAFTGADLREPVSLFRTHFILFNALYRLDERLADQQLQLEISPLLVRLQPRRPGKAGIENRDPLRAYYLDSSQLDDISAEQVTSLLDGSLRRLQAGGEIDAALACLEFCSSQPRPEAAGIRHRYRQLASRHHPDRGGSTERLQELNQAMQLLRQHGLL